MGTNPLVELGKLGQSPWLDFIERGLVSSGGLLRLVSGDGITGVTSNPTIFEKAIAGSSDDLDKDPNALAVVLMASALFQLSAVCAVWWFGLRKHKLDRRALGFRKLSARPRFCSRASQRPTVFRPRGS